MLSIQELRSSSQKELLLELQKARKEMVRIRISLKTKHEKDTSKARKEKRMIAQILTVLKEFDKEPSPKTAKPSLAKAKEVSAPDVVAKPAPKKSVAKASASSAPAKASTTKKASKASTSSASMK